MIKKCANGQTLRGIDIYHGDMISDVNLLKGWACFAFLKAYERSVDPLFSSRWISMKRNGILRAPYDFFHPGIDAKDQARAFLATIPDYGPGDLPCILDWETTDGAPSSSDKEAGYVWLSQVEAATKKSPIIYGSPYFLQALSLDQRFARFPLYVAHYAVACPLVPAPWNTWTFWQNSDSGKVPGIRGHCDTDVFDGNMSQLLALAK